jgi:hypothetical protein
LDKAVAAYAALFRLSCPKGKRAKGRAAGGCRVIAVTLDKP